jgi:hypothetical protein
MSNKGSEVTETPRQRLYVLLAAATVSAAVLGLVMLWLDKRHENWKEEVQLADGRKIVVTQRRDHIPGYGTRRTWLSFNLPEMGGEQTWSENMQPALIAVTANGTVYVAGWPSGESQMEMYRHPRYGYAAYRWSGAGFDRVPFLSIPEGLRKEENVIRCIPNSKFVSWTAKLVSGCDEKSVYVSGAKRDIDLHKMEAWALAQAARQNIKPLSE